MKYLPTIGLEIHAELNTDSKMFCSCKNDPNEEKPNTNICPICLGHPGTLPVLNKEAIKNVLRIGVAVGGKLADFTEWDRKQYFYPDIPKGYQISQYTYPLITGGSIRGIELERIHLEEDTAQSTHDTHEKSLINFNRSGVPLMELVTKPVIHDANTAVMFAKELQLLLRYLGAGDANMEKGEMRVEANISVAPLDKSNLSDIDLLRRSMDRHDDKIGCKDTSVSTVEAATNVDLAKPTKTFSRAEEGEAEGSTDLEGKMNCELGTKTEVKNLNSFRAVDRAIDFEIKRQIDILERGESVVQETRGWDDKKGITYSQRSKESAHDYRYFPEPDIPKMKLSEIPEFSYDSLKESLPELPREVRERFTKDYGATEKEVAMFVENVELAKYFEKIVAELGEDSEDRPAEGKVGHGGLPSIRIAMNYLLTDYLGALKKIAGPMRYDILPKNWAELVSMIVGNEISSRGAKDTLAIMINDTKKSPRDIVKENNLLKENNIGAVEEVVKKVIEENKKVVDEYVGGKTNSLQFLIGQVMKVTKGSSDPREVSEVLAKLLQNKV
ncbi:MAG: Asp-tRNA(Asn)/Glu-tRNA(Gln) amidotransferase subunit GatB [Candidatus Paceibacterota bacterium]|jgi:aspartyl-tRNA(Asn)/glutamyl-tRNA(Gln) amidotransferase subunit B